MKTHIAFRTVIAALAVMFLTAAASDTWAACGSGDRMSHRDSFCLQTSWDNNSWPHTTSYEMRNICSSWGKVVAKVDRKNDSDLTLHLVNDSTRTGSGWYKIRWIYCCEDISDLCNRSDMQTNASCREGFEDNDELDDCTLDAGSEGARIQGEQCVYSASCLDNASQPNDTTFIVFRPDVDDLKNCNGVLKKDSC